MRWPLAYRVNVPGLFLLFLGLSGCASSESERNPARATELDVLPDKVLFVGNSFTYYNNSLHRHFRLLTHESGLFTLGNSRARSMTISGGELPEHAGGFEHVLGTDDWDVVVMQGHSLGPISENTAEPFRRAARKFARIARRKGVRPAFFMTWAYTDKPEMTARLDTAYSDIGRELDAQVVPVGLAFARATRERPDIDLRTSDLRHPSMAGTYLAACTFFAALYEQSPEGLDYDAGLGEKTAAYLQRVAWQTVKNYASRERQWTFTNWAGSPVPVRTYVPTRHDDKTPIVIVMHGASRDAPRYYDDWKTLAEAQDFIVVVPHFSRQRFPGSAGYNLGNVFDLDARLQHAKNRWTFSAIEPLFDDVVRRLGGAQTSYILYGHSAGSQFVHRFMYYTPEARASKFIAANAGWYTMPDFTVDYPYGLKSSGIREDALPQILAKPLILLQGDADIDVNAEKLRKTPEAERQGANRLARGKAMYRAGKARAGEIGTDFNWQIHVVDGADHDNARMAPAAAALIP